MQNKPPSRFLLFFKSCCFVNVIKKKDLLQVAEWKTCAVFIFIHDKCMRVWLLDEKIYHYIINILTEWKTSHVSHRIISLGSLRPFCKNPWHLWSIFAATVWRCYKITLFSSGFLSRKVFLRYVNIYQQK